jgi:DNA-nicking Smr family endonuclease
VPRPPRRLTPEELALWHHVTRTIAPLHADDAPPPSPLPPKLQPQPPAVGTRPEPKPTIAAALAPSPAPFLPTRPPPIRPSRRLDPIRPVDLDRRTWLKVRRGLYPIDARLDLHGLTQDQAHDRLTGFLRGAHTRGNRCVLVITGRGARSGGTLRAMTPRWLDEAPARPLVLAFTEARLEHGGEGALYVLLRRRG